MQQKRTNDCDFEVGLRAMLLFAVGLLLASCTPVVNPANELAPVNAPFSTSGSAKTQPEWWTSFDDPQLNRLVETALSNSPDLLSVWERLQANRALARRARADLLPKLDANLGAASERQSGDTIDLFTSGLSASYEVDLWGRIRSEAEAQRLRTEATRADYETAALTLSGEVALTWYRLLARTEILALIEDQIAANEKVAKSLIGRFRGGEARSVDVLRQEQLIEATRELKIVTDSEISVLENQLQFLLGNAPQKSLSHTKAALPELPPLPDAGLPAELLLRRPNLKASYLELLATNQDFASAVSERYPRIDLTASLRSASEDSSDLFNDWLSSIAGNIAAPIIDGGNRRAEVERQAALQRQRAAEFAQDSLVAFREVEDALVQEKQETLRYQSLNRQVELQKTAFEQLQKEFLNGVGNFIDVLAAQTSAQQLQRDLIESKRRQIEFRIALHRSIAGPIQAQEKRK